MANIQEHLNTIKNSIYGKEVRGAIHDSIKQCYDDASVEHDNANMEVKLARGVYNTLNDRLEESDKIQKEFSSSLDNIEKVELPKLDNKRYKITKSTKKIFDDAVVLNVNNTGKQAEICGFRSKEELANYPDRDSVIIYTDNTLPNCKILEVVSFTSNSVTVIGDTSSVEEGMVIDCMNQNEIDPFYQVNKFSGFVTSVSGQTINVSGWYKQGNTAEGQIPDKDRVIINPITKGWLQNGNMFLNADSFAWGGNVAEYGLWNRKSKAFNNKNYRLNGIDMFVYDGYSDYLYNASALYDSCEVDKGYRAIKCNSGYYSRLSKNIGFESNGSKVGHKSIGATEVGFLTENEPKGFSSVGNDVCFEANTDISKVAFKTTNDCFRVNGMGVIKNLMLNRKIYPTATTLTPNDAFFHIVQQTGGKYTLPNPSNYGLCNIKILATSDVILSGSMMTNTGNISTYNLGAWRTVEFYCDGTTWIRIF